MNPAGDGGPTSTAATSKNPGDLDSAIDQGLLWPAWPRCVCLIGVSADLSLKLAFTVTQNKAVQWW